MDQSVVVNHATPFDPSNPQFVNEKRNILEESARISRGKIEELEKIDVNQHDALILPGGFGVPTSFGSNIGNPKEFKVHPLIEKYEFIDICPFSINSFLELLEISIQKENQLA